MDEKETLDRCIEHLKRMTRIFEGKELRKRGAMLVSCAMDEIFGGVIKEEVKKNMDRAQELSSRWNIPLIETSTTTTT